MFIPLLFSCSNKKPELNIELIRQAHLSDLPSASGIEYTNGITYLVGDDMRWLVALDDDMECNRKNGFIGH